MLLRPSSGFTQLPRSVACSRSTWQLSCARICAVGESRTSHRGRPLHAPAAASGGLRAGCGAAGGRVGCRGLEEAAGIRRRRAGAWSPLCFFPTVTLVRSFDFSGPGVFTCEKGVVVSSSAGREAKGQRRGNSSVCARSVFARCVVTLVSRPEKLEKGHRA